MNIKEMLSKEFNSIIGDVDKTVPFKIAWFIFKININVRVQYKPSTGFLKITLS